MEFRIVRWYGERKTVTRVQSFEEAYAEYNRVLKYNRMLNCDTIQVYAQSLLIAQKEF